MSGFKFILWGVLCFLAVAGSLLGNDKDDSVIAWGVPWGWSGAIQVPGDYDGDGINDLAVYDPNGGYWYIASFGEADGTAYINEFQGVSSGSYSVPLTRLTGRIVNRPVREGSVSILLRDAALGYGYGVLLGAFTDFGDGTLQGTALLEGVVPLNGWGEINYVTGDWSLNLSLPGMVGTYKSFASYRIKARGIKVVTWRNQWGWNGARPIPGDYDGDGLSDLAVVDQNTGKWYIKSLSKAISEFQGAVSGTYAVPLTLLSGHLVRIPVVAGSASIFLRDLNSGVLLGPFTDSGDGTLQGTALLEGVVPINGSGQINYLTGAWYVILSLPGMTGTFTIDARYRHANP